MADQSHDEQTSAEGSLAIDNAQSQMASHVRTASADATAEDSSLPTTTSNSPLAVKPEDSEYGQTSQESTPPLLPEKVEGAEDAGQQPVLADLLEGDKIAQSADATEKAGPFQRLNSPADTKRNKGAIYETVGDQGVSKMQKFSVYETATRYYVVGADVMDEKFRILKIDRNADDGVLSVAEDEIVYTKTELKHVLAAIGDGNKSTGGIKLKCSTWGLLGFIRFTGPYYMILITKRSQVAMIGGHYVYQIDETDLVPLVAATNSRFKTESRNAEEARFVGILNNLDLSRSFYFSYSYDITRTLQHNIIRERDALIRDLPFPYPPDHHDMFVWNDHLLKPAREALKNTFDWCLPIIHGYIDQAALSIYGRTVHITIIARRSRIFAGARFLKRGANDQGYVANDVETEQIVADGLTTSFHSPGPVLFANPGYTSYVQHRGSIPLYWSQDNTGVTPKPPIELNLVDPFYSPAALHFDDLFHRYGAPVYVLNLVKAKERIPRESKLLKEFTSAINYLNQSLPEGKKIIHKAWDMSRASKSRDQDVIGTLESIAEDVVTTTGFFRNGDGKTVIPRLQNGVARTNCIDCLDRTNAAQFVIGKRALGYQLNALGVIEGTTLEYDTDATNLFTHMYHDHGDTIAVQYGGSQLVNTMATYRKINQWTSNSRDMVESFKRYYNNSFLDGQRQEAYNLFLGNYIWAQGQPMLWDLVTDYYLHHKNPRAWSAKQRRNYITWFTPKYLEERKMPDDTRKLEIKKKERSLSFYDDYWREYYRPSALSSFLKIYSFKMNSTLKYIPVKSTESGKYDLSPFKVRTDMDQDVVERKRSKRQLLDETDDASSIRSATTVTNLATKRSSLQRWLQPEETASVAPSIERSTPKSVTITSPRRQKLMALDISKAAQMTFKQVVQDSLDPFVTDEEMDDYARYISHPQTLPLVVSNDTPLDIDEEYVEFVNGSWQDSFSPHYISDDDTREYAEFLTVPDNPLEVTEEDAQKKRYKAYRKWHNGKSLFKQQPID